MNGQLWEVEVAYDQGTRRRLFVVNYLTVARSKQLAKLRVAEDHDHQVNLIGCTVFSFHAWRVKELVILKRSTFRTRKEQKEINARREEKKR